MASEAKDIVGYRPGRNGLEPLDDEQDRQLTGQAQAELDRGDFITETEMDRIFDRMLVDLPPE